MPHSRMNLPRGQPPCWAAGFLLLALFSPGCTGVSPSVPKTLNIWSAPRGVEEKGFLRLCRRFEQDHPGIEVRNLGGIDEYKLIRAIVAGAPPDLAYLYGTGEVGPLAANGALAPLDEPYRQSGFRDEQFLPGIMAQHRYRGRLYAMPVTRDSMGLYWNRPAFREAGLDPDRPPRTLEETRSFAVRLTKRAIDGSLLRIGFNAVPDDPSALLSAAGFRLLEEAPGRLRIDSPENVAALAWLVQLVDEMGGRTAMARLRSSFGRSDTAQNPLATGKVAMEINGEWISMHLEKYAPDTDYGIGEIPYPEGHPERRNMAWSDGDVMIVPAEAPHGEMAWEFMRWMQQPRQQEEYAGVMNNLPSIRALLRSPVLTTGSRKRRTLGFILQTIAGSSRNVRYFPVLPVSRFYRETLIRAVEAAELHQKTPAQALRDAQNRVQTALSRYGSGTD